MIADAFRFVALALGGGVIGMSALVVYAYARRYIIDRRLARAQGDELKWRGLLPLHVAGIGASHLLLASTAMQQVYVNLGEPMHWNTATRATGITLSAASLFALLRWQRRIYPRHDESPPTPPLTVAEPTEPDPDPDGYR